MNDAFRMGCFERLGGLTCDAQGLVGWNRVSAIIQTNVQSVAGHELHDEEAVLTCLLEAVDGRNVGMFNVASSRASRSRRPRRSGS